MEANGRSDRKSDMTCVGWLYGCLPAKREEAWRERCQSHPLCQQRFYFLCLCQRLWSEDALKLFFLDPYKFTTLMNAETVSVVCE